MKAKVKWWNDNKGFGFFVHPENGKDIFVHYSKINTEGFKTLIENAEYEFELVETLKGLSAQNVRKA